MAIDAGNEIMGRGGPSLVIGLHDVALPAELGAGAVLVGASQPSKKNDAHYQQNDS